MPDLPLPENETLAEIARALDEASMVATLMDPEFRLVWLSHEFRAMFGEQEDPEQLGIGGPIVKACQSDLWRATFGDETVGEIARRTAKYWLNTEAGRRALEELPELKDVVQDVEPEPLPAAWTVRFKLTKGDEVPPSPVAGLGMKIVGGDGTQIGIVESFNSALPPHITNMLLRGDEKLFERMARLVEPGQHEAAVLFADIGESSVLARRLPTAIYFDLISALTTRIDAEVINRSGIPAKHAGDGATAFFLADDLGSPSAAVRAAIETARALTKAAADAVAQASNGADMLEPDDCIVNAGLHWGGTLYVGQVVTGGRLEVTAIGDEVNEAARIQETAHDGQILGSKLLIEQLSEEDAAALGIDTTAVAYRQILELDEAPEKAVRDAGAVPVTAI